MVNACANLAAGVVVYRCVPETRPEPVPRPGTKALPAGAVHRDRPFLVLLGSVLPLGILFQQPLVALPLTMTADGLSPAGYGLAMMMNGLVIVVFQIPLTRLAGRLRPEFALAAASALTGIGLGCTAAVHSVPGYAATVVLWSLGELVIWPTCMTLVAALAPPHQQGAYQGWVLSVWSVSVALAPLFSSQLIGAFDGTAVVWTACLILALIAATAHLLLARLRRRLDEGNRLILSALPRVRVFLRRRRGGRSPGRPAHDASLTRVASRSRGKRPRPGCRRRAWGWRRCRWPAS